MTDTSSIAAEKKARRLEGKAIRRQLAMKKLSAQIRDHIAQWEVFQQAERVFLFSALPDEVDLFPLIDVFPAKRWYLPRVQQDSLQNKLCFYRYHAGDVLEKGQYGILEPLEQAPLYESGPCLVFVPALMLDPSGYRLGYGKGYYDRFLAGNTTHVVTACPIPAALVVPHVPHDTWDIPVDWGVCETGILPKLGPRSAST